MREAREWIGSLLMAALAFSWLIWSHRRRARRTRDEYERDVRRWRRAKHVYRALLYFPPEALPSTARPQRYDAARPAPAEDPGPESGSDR